MLSFIFGPKSKKARDASLDSALSSDFHDVNAGLLGSPGSEPESHFPRMDTHNTRDSFTSRASSAWRRTYTFDRTATNMTNMTNLIGIDLENEEGWTRRLLDEYARVAVKGVEGDVPLPLGFAKSTQFWRMFLLAGFLGFFIGLFGLGFMNLADQVPKQWAKENDFSNPSSCDFYAGDKRWILVTGSAGLLVGLLRYFTAYPDNLPGLFKEIKDCHVDPKYSITTIALSAISLCGGANLGPEQALGNLGGGAATYLTQYITFEDDDRKLVVLSGMTSALGALFPTPMLAVLMLYELGSPPKTYMESITILAFSACISFITYYGLVDYTYLDHIKTNPLAAYQWEFDEWQCTTGFVIGCICAALSLFLILCIGITKQIFLRLRTRLQERNRHFLSYVLPPVIGGITVGCVNWALPLTVGSGNMVLQGILSNGYKNLLSTDLLLCSGFAKLFLLSVCMNCGFIGGFVFPQIAVATMAGVICHMQYPYIPIGLSVGCFVSALPGALIPAPYTMACLPIFIFYFGLYQTAPIFIATLTSYIILCGSGLMTALAERNQMNAQQAAEAAALAAQRHGGEEDDDDDDGNNNNINNINNHHVRNGGKGGMAHSPVHQGAGGGDLENAGWRQTGGGAAISEKERENQQNYAIGAYLNAKAVATVNN